MQRKWNLEYDKGFIVSTHPPGDGTQPVFGLMGVTKALLCCCSLL